MNIVVLGSGGWGTALAMLLEQNRHTVTLWSHDHKKAEQLKLKRENPLLPGVQLPVELQITNDLNCLRNAELVVFAPPSFALRAVAKEAAPYLPDGVPLFLFVGRLMWYKGLHIILDALRALREQGQDFRMVFIGAGGDEKEVRAEVETLRLSDRCFFTGSIADRETLRAWYSRADLFLFPSTFDTNGLVVREAAASGCPSVLIAGSCAAEGVTDGRNGFLIEENAVSLCAKLTALCADREAMRRVGENAMRELYLSWEDAVARANERYAVVLDRYRSRKYPKHERFSDEFFNTQGDLMEAMSRVAEMRGETGRLCRELREGFDEAREALREKLEKEW